MFFFCFFMCMHPMMILYCSQSYISFLLLDRPCQVLLIINISVFLVSQLGGLHFISKGLLHTTSLATPNLHCYFLWINLLMTVYEWHISMLKIYLELVIFPDVSFNPCLNDLKLYSYSHTRMRLLEIWKSQTQVQLQSKHACLCKRQEGMLCSSGVLQHFFLKKYNHLLK